MSDFVVVEGVEVAEGRGRPHVLLVRVCWGKVHWGRRDNTRVVGLDGGGTRSGGRDLLM